MNDRVLASILERLIRGDATAGEIAADTGLPSEAVRRRLRGLTRSGVVERRGRTRRGGRTEFLYSHDPREGLLDSGELSGLNERRVAEAAAQTIRLILGEASAAIQAGAIAARPDSAVIQFTFPTDDGRPSRAARIHEDLLEEIFAVAELAKDRLATGKERPIEATAALLLVPLSDAALADSIAGARRELSAATRLSTRHPVDTMLSLAHPLRVGLLDLLTLAPASAAEVAELTGVEPARCRAELKRLLDLGVVKIHDRRQRRGTQEYVYVAENRKMVIGTEDLARHDGRGLDRFDRMILSRILRDALRATREGAVGREGEGLHLARLPMRIDPRAFTEISKAIDRALERLFDLKDSRLAEADGSRVTRAATSGMLLFERAPGS